MNTTITQAIPRALGNKLSPTTFLLWGFNDPTSNKLIPVFAETEEGQTGTSVVRDIVSGNVHGPVLGIYYFYETSFCDVTLVTARIIRDTWSKDQLSTVALEFLSYCNLEPLD